MAKFKVGQWVRVLHTDYKEEFPVGSAFKVGKVYDHGVDPDGEYRDLFFLCHEIEPWQPKVGERVTANSNTHVNIEQHWNEYFRRSYGEIIDGALIVTSVEDHAGSNIGLSNKVGRSHFFMPTDGLEPANFAPATAALKIEAGKFYKTRDGRKVGPMERYEGGWSMNGDEYGRMWKDNGTRYYGGNEETDLIAEWVDEVAKASNDNGVKVGDKVRALADDIDITEGHVYEVLEIDAEGAVRVIDDVDDNWWIDSGNFEVVSPAVANDNAATAKFKVGDRVRVVATGDAWQDKYKGTTFTIDSDEGDLDGEQSWAGKDHKSPYRWKESQLELASASTPAIVCLIENGQPEPAVGAFVHPDEQSAAKEASRLAGIYKGKEFGVYVLTSTAKEERTYDHEWQRLAAKGEKIAAIRLLRQATGLHLATAKTAVEDWVVRAA